MFPIKKYFHLLLMLSEFILAVMLLVLFTFGINLINKGNYDIFWICSKIETIDNILSDNIKLGAIDSIVFGINEIKNYTRLSDYNYYGYLSLSYMESRDKNNICGILDTYENIMYLPNDKSCPDNEFNIDNNETPNNLDITENDTIGTFSTMVTTYINNSTSILRLLDMNIEGQNNPAKEILVYIDTNDELTKFINRVNFCPHDETYKKFFDKDKYEDDEETQNEMFKKMNNEDNIDKYAKKYTFPNLTFYSKNYIGFNSYEDLKFLMSQKENLIHLNQIKFPNLASTIFAIISFVVLLALLLFSLEKFLTNDKKKNIYKKNRDLLSSLIIGFIYLTILIGYTIYLIYICVQINKDNKCSALKKIESDDNIKNYIKEACKVRLEYNYLIAGGLTLFVISLILFIIAWSFEQLYESYLKIKGRKLDLQWRYMEKKYKLSY